MSKNAKKSGITKWSVFTALMAVLLAVSLVAGQIANNFATTINIYLGTSTYKVISGDSNEDTEYFKSAFASEQELVDFEYELCAAVEAEGAALLMNNNNALPLAPGAKVSLFSHSSVDLMYGGTGSGAVDTENAPTLKDAMESVDISVNEKLWNFYGSDAIDSVYKRQTSGFISDDYFNCTKLFAVNEVPWNMVVDGAGDSFASYGDAAIVVLARSGGEGSDLPSGDNGSGLDWIYSEEDADGNYLNLTQEEIDMLAGLKDLKDQGVFSKIIVLLNTSNAIQLDFLNPEICGVDYGIDACMWIGDVGFSGIVGVARLLAGEVSPSGSLVDTYYYDNLANPAIVNFYAQQYENWEEAGLSFGDYDSPVYGKIINWDVTNSYTVYQEGIYVGYRYTETRYEDAVMGTGNAGNFDYNKVVAYPFGYGLSYTAFDFSDYAVTETDDAFEISVKVTNAGETYSGKKTVQVYFQSPYTDYDKQNGIEKAAVELCGFAKTDILAPGASETVTISVPKTELRTYDSNNAKTYILDAGDYYFTVANGAHEAANNILSAKGFTGDAEGNTDLVWKWNNPELDTTSFSTSFTGEQITNLFDESDPNKSSVSPGSVTWLSRSDWEGTYPATSDRGLVASDALIAALEYIQYDASEHESVEMPTLGADNGLTLAMFIGAEYDDPNWDALLDQITWDEMVNCITLGYHGTAAIPSIGKAATHEENGPQGLTAALTGGDSAMCYTSEDVMAATFNTELIKTVGECIGEDCLMMGYSGLYGPGVNIHRTAYSGRNFEYYSEDPFISGTICAAEVQGIQSKGVYVYMKHVALNDSETFRCGICTWINEQAAREIYLEVVALAAENGDATGVMSGFDRWGAQWSGENYNLLTGFLREELGMTGIFITDYSGTSYYMDTPDALLAGTNLWDSPDAEIHPGQLASYGNDPVIVSAARNAMHRILYNVANSNAMNGISSNDQIVSVTPWWQTAILALQVTLGVLTVLCAWQLFVAIKKNKAAKAA